MPQTNLFDGKYFGTVRFDRDGTKKYHVVSVAGLLGADYRLPCIDYWHIFNLSLNLSKNMEDSWKIYRLMVFNFLIENKDDHAKNFAFLYKDDKWQFSPAYDLLPGGGINGYRTTSINDSIEPRKKDIIELAKRVSLDPKQAETIFDEMKEILNFKKKN